MHLSLKPSSRYPLFGLIALFYAFSPICMYAAQTTFTWIGGASGDWNAAGNWSVAGAFPGINGNSTGTNSVAFFAAEEGLPFGQVQATLTQNYAQYWVGGIVITGTPSDSTTALLTVISPSSNFHIGGSDPNAYSGIDMTETSMNVQFGRDAVAQGAKITFAGNNAYIKIHQNGTLSFYGNVFVGNVSTAPNATLTLNSKNSTLYITSAPNSGLGAGAWMVGSGIGTTGTVRLQDMLIQLGGGAYNFVGHSGGTGVLLQTGGTVQILNTAGLSVGAPNATGNAAYANTTGTYKITGGLLTSANNNFYVGGNGASGNNAWRTYGTGYFIVAGSGTAILPAVNIASGTQATGNVYIGDYSTSGSYGGLLQTSLIIKQGNGSTTGGAYGTYSDPGAVANLYFDGGTLKVNGVSIGGVQTGTRFLEGLDSATILAGGAIIDTNGNNATINQDLAGSANDGGLTKQGNGFLTLGGVNTYTGATTINGGRLQVSKNAALSANGNLAVNSGTFWIDTGNANTLNLQVATLSGSVGGSIIHSVGAQNGTLTSVANTSSTFAGIMEQQGGGTFEFVKKGSGILTFTGTADYTNSGNPNGKMAVTVEQGALYIGNANSFDNNSTNANNILSVKAGATLGGIGAATNNGSRGTANITNLSLEGGSILKLSLGATPAASDLLHVSGTFTLTGVTASSKIDLSLDVASVALDTPYTLAEWTAAIGFTPSSALATDYFTLSGISGMDYTLEWGAGNKSLILTFTPVPEPGLWALLGAGTSALLYLRRRKRAVS